jgi:hypothetical protein
MFHTDYTAKFEWMLLISPSQQFIISLWQFCNRFLTHPFERNYQGHETTLLKENAEKKIMMQGNPNRFISI